jgi:uncharacterized protein YjeT (DUF2065 family)
MNAIVKLIIGVLVVIAGIAWYIYPNAVTSLFTIDPFASLQIILAGLVGLGLIILGLLLVWINIEEIREGSIGKK